MIKKISALIVCAVLGAGVSHATTIQLLKPGLGKDYVFPRNEPVVLSNPVMFTVKAACTIASEIEDNLISFTVLRKTGSFNGTKLIAGDNISYIVRNEETIMVTAVPGAQVEFLNLGESTIVATCSVT